MHLRLQANPALRHCFAVLPAAYADRLRAESATAVRPIERTQIQSTQFLPPHQSIHYLRHHTMRSPCRAPSCWSSGGSAPIWVPSAGPT